MRIKIGKYYITQRTEFSRFYLENENGEKINNNETKEIIENYIKQNQNYSKYFKIEENRLHWLEDKTIEYIFVPKIVESIEVYCFRDNNNIKFAYLGNNIKKISPHAFSGCTNLKEVIIPRSLDIIQQYAFSDCENLKTIYYEGTEKEWKQIKKNRYWKYGSPIDIITKDGLIK